MEIARIKMLEDENLRLNQALDKSNHGKVYTIFIPFLCVSVCVRSKCIIYYIS